MNKREILFFVVPIAIFALIATYQKSHKPPDKQAQIHLPPPKEMKVKVLIETSSAAKNPSVKKKHSGAMPPITATYRQTIGFETYAKMMEQRGSVFLMRSDSDSVTRVSSVFKRSCTPKKAHTPTAVADNMAKRLRIGMLIAVLSDISTLPSAI